ncbi:MAG: LTA synthase family protein [Spirosomataceae bacterium]
MIPQSTRLFLLFWTKYSVGWLFVLTICRFFYLGYTQNAAPLLTSPLSWAWKCLKLDTATIAWLILPLVFSSFFVKRGFFPFSKLYFYTIGSLIGLITLIDAELTRVRGYRLDASIWFYSSSWQASLGSVQMQHLFLLVLVLLAVVGILFWLGKKLVDKPLPPLVQRGHGLLVLVVLVVAGYVVPSRMGYAPFITHQLAMTDVMTDIRMVPNTAWNLMHSNVLPTVQAVDYQFMPNKEADSLMKNWNDFLVQNAPILRQTDKPINVLLIVWESLTAKALQSVNGRVSYVPNFENWTKKGLYFPNVYATAERSERALVGILSGCPTLPNMSLLFDRTLIKRLPNLAKTFAQQGYQTSFVHGGETDFAEIRPYLLAGGFDRIVDKRDFSINDWNAVWGVSDATFFRRLLQEINQGQQPFFTTAFTLSSHEPYDVPHQPVGQSETAQLLHSLRYTDACLHQFLTQASQQSWWNNTLVIIVADHGHHLPVNSLVSEQYHIPMLWLGGALAVADSIVQKPVAQIDLAGTLLSQLHWPRHNYRWSRNALSSHYNSWCYYACPDFWGWVTPNKTWQQTPSRVMKERGEPTTNELLTSKAFLQSLTHNLKQLEEK